MSYKSDFPLFENYPDLVYLDNAATVQKPKAVIDTVNTYLTHKYANVHRGVYDLSQASEEIFWQARKTVATWMGCRNDEVVFTPWTTIGINMLASSLIRSELLTKESCIVLSIWEHHANIVPWQILAEQTWAAIKRIEVDEDGIVHYEKLQELMHSWWVTVVALQSCSNVTWAINDLERVRSIIWEDVLLVVDASQSCPHYRIELEKVQPDFLFCTGHKIGAHTGSGVMIGKKKLLDTLTPWWWWWGAIERVKKDGHTYQWTPDKFEPWTPNLIWAVSIAAAIDYIQSMWWLIAIDSHERILVEYCLAQSIRLEKYWLTLVWPRSSKDRIGVFSFASNTRNLHQLWQRLAQENVCVRTGWQCAHPLHKYLGNEWTLRMSLWITNDMSDCERFFNIINDLLS